MQLKEKYWVDLLRYWDDKGRNGLSIPFIIGVVILFDDNYKPTKEDAAIFLNSLFQIKIPDGIFKIDWCEEINAPIIGFVSNTYKKSLGAGLYFPRHFKEEYTVFVSSRILQDLDTNVQEELIRKLSEHSASAIENCNFSRKRYGWINYTVSDIEMISLALKM